MSAKKSHIDLLTRRDISHKTVGRLLLWVLTIGRYIAIFTELIVIIGVIARFALDYQRNTITENIIEQQTIINSYKSTESRIRRIHHQLATISELEKSGIEAEKIISLISQLTPIDTYFESMEIKSDLVSLEGISLSIQGFSTFLSKLYNHSFSKDIILDSVKTGGPRDPSIHFKIAIEYDSLSLENNENISAEVNINYF